MANQAAGTIAGTLPSVGRSTSVYRYRPKGIPVLDPIASIAHVPGPMTATAAPTRRAPHRRIALAPVRAAIEPTTTLDRCRRARPPGWHNGVAIIAETRVTAAVARA